MSQAIETSTTVSHDPQGQAGSQSEHEPLHPENLHSDLTAMRKLAQGAVAGNAQVKRDSLADLARMLCHLERVIGEDAAAAAESRKPEPLQGVRLDLEDQQADLCSHAALLNFLGDSQGTAPGEQTLGCAFYGLANAAEAIKDKLGGIVERLMALEEAPHDVTETELRVMARRAWKERGIVILWPEKISDSRQRSALLNVATSQYGPRGAATGLVIKVERIKSGKAGGK